MGRPPLGEVAMTAAQRQARHRAMQNSDSVTEDAPLPERSPERQKLAQAIAYYDGIMAQQQRVAEVRKRLAVGDKRRTLEDAQRAFEQARERAPHELIARAMGEPFDPARTVEHAEGLLDGARRDLAQATEADQILIEEARQLEQRLTVARIGRDDALGKVLATAPEVLALSESFAATRQKMWGFTWVFRAIGSRHLPQGAWDGILWGAAPAAAAEWETAIKELEADADVPLPAE